MDDGNNYRGWDLWIEGDKRRHAHHQRLARRRPQGGRQNAAQARTSGTHVFVDLRRLGKAGRREDLLQRRSAADRRRSRQLQDTIRTKVPFKIGQRHTERALRGRRRCRICGSTAAR